MSKGRAYIIAIPAALRRRCGLRPGDRVLLAAGPHPSRPPWTRRC
jgi:bifunctional DNA-binding transcriptional regulator/antitoxin component of YhaV-PrlF toxin-antitoxin module